MNLIGDLERLFATSLYPFRVPVAIAVTASLVALAVVARRRGWFAAARRHPRLTGSVLAIALVVGLPIAWYLASPLVIRTELFEPLPVALADPAASASVVPSDAASTSPSVAPDNSGTPEPSATAPASPIASPTPFAPAVLASGSFRGADDFHYGDGTASVIETEPGRFTLRFEEFSVRNGPDLYVYLSPDRDGYAPGALELGRLKATDGAFGYELPVGTEPQAFESVVVWCKEFAVLFAVAPLSVE